MINRLYNNIKTNKRKYKRKIEENINDYLKLSNIPMKYRRIDNKQRAKMYMADFIYSKKLQNPLKYTEKSKINFKAR